jgi:uncharacterized FlgJ-related protein
MLYTYCKKTLLFKKIKTTKILKVLFTISVLLGLGLTLAFNTAVKNHLEDQFNSMPFEKRVIVINGTINDSFNQDQLAEELRRLNIKFPHIVMAQAIIESGHFKSNVFRANNNLFGMKLARQRATTAKGTNLNHAYYENWRESVLDYALFQSAYLRNLKTEEAYLEYLDKNYAMAPNYDDAIRTVISNNKLKEVFKEDI